MFGYKVSNQRRRSCRRPARYATSHSNPVMGMLDQVWSSVLFDASSRSKVPWLLGHRVAHRPRRPVGPHGSTPSGRLTQPDVTGTNNNLTNDYTGCDICGNKITERGAERSHCSEECYRFSSPVSGVGKPPASASG
jgi:hypothetical protein